MVTIPFMVISPFLVMSPFMVMSSFIVTIPYMVIFPFMVIPPFKVVFFYGYPLYTTAVDLHSARRQGSGKSSQKVSQFSPMLTHKRNTAYLMLTAGMTTSPSVTHVNGRLVDLMTHKHIFPAC